MKYLLLTFLFLTHHRLSSQIESFDYYYESEHDDIIWDAEQNAHGNYYLLIESRATSNNSIKTRIVKLDTKGRYLRELVLVPQSFSNYIQTLLSINNDEIIAYGSVKPTENVASKAYLVKIDTNLNIKWEKSFGVDSTDQHIEALKLDHDSSGFIAVGNLSIEIGFTTKLNLNGDSIIQKNFSFASTLVRFFDVLTRDDGEAYYVFSLGAIQIGDTSSINTGACRVIKLNKNLEIDTILSLNTSLKHPHEPWHVAFDNTITAKWITDSSFIIGGLVTNRIDDNFWYNPKDLALMTWDTNFNELNFQIHGEYDVSEHSGVRAMDFQSANSIYLTGTNKFFPNRYFDRVVDFTLYKTNVYGNLSWHNTYSNNSHLRLLSILATDDGGALLLGSSYKEGLNIFNESDGYALKVDSNGMALIRPVGMNKRYDISDNLVFYPNPVEDVLYIRTNSFTKVDRILIYSNTGQLIDESNSTTINTREWKSGIFLIEVTTKNGVLRGKVIKP